MEKNNIKKHKKQDLKTINQFAREQKLELRTMGADGRNFAPQTTPHDGLVVDNEVIVKFKTLRVQKIAEPLVPWHSVSVVLLTHTSQHHPIASFPKTSP